MAPAFHTTGVATSSAKMLKLGLEKTMMAVSVAASHTNWTITNARAQVKNIKKKGKKVL
jgi:2-methylcitrate dehydratase PrpD